MEPLKIREYKPLRSNFLAFSMRFIKRSESVVNTSDDTTLISLVDKPNKLIIPTRPARDSLTFCIITNACDPVTQKSPLRFDLSTAILIYGNNSAAVYWISSIKTGGVYLWKNNAGSLFAKYRISGSSNVTILRLGSANLSSIVDFPTWRGPITSITGNVADVFRTVSSALFLYTQTNTSSKVKYNFIIDEFAYFVKSVRPPNLK